MHIHQRFLFSLIALGLLVAGNTAADTLRYVPLDDPVYDFLHYARISGDIGFLPQVRPYTRGLVTDLLTEASRSAESPWITRRAEEHMARLTQPGTSVFTGRFGENGTVSLDAAVTLRTDAVLNRFEDTIPAATVPISLSVSPADTVHVSLDVRPALAYWSWYERPDIRYRDPLLSDYYAYTYWFDTGTGSFNHGGAHTPGRPSTVMTFDTTNQFTVDAGYLQLTMGREALDWGPSREANLALSATAKPYDYLGFTMPLGGAGSFAWITGILQDFAYEAGPMEERLINAHRIGYQVTDWLYLALYESVIYDLTFELAYLSPLSFYYVTEVTQGSPDNKLGGADIIVNLPNVELYGSLFADDWDAGRPLSFNASHNEWAGTLGARSAGLFTPGLLLNAELTYLSHWMYTHFTWTDISNVGKSYQHYGTPLGHYLGPNSWMLLLDGRYDLAAGSWASTAFRLIQDGRGDINTPPNWSAESALHDVANYRDITYSFLDRGKPGFTIDTTIDWTLSGHHTFEGSGLSVEAAYTVQHSFAQATEDMARVPDSALTEHFVSIEGRWTPGTLLHRRE